MRRRWEDRFDLVQVDEMQHTHLAEYLVLRTLAGQAQSVVLAGDFDRTIYESGGSEPDKVLEQFRHDNTNRQIGVGVFLGLLTIAAPLLVP